MADAYTTQSYGYQDPGFSYSVAQTQTTQQPSPPRSRNTGMIILIIVGVILFILILFLLLGVGSSSPSDNTGQDQTPSDEPAVLQWWGMFLDSEVVQPLIDEYQSQNPNITIEYANRRPTGSFESAEQTYRNSLNDLLRENDPVQIPDIFMVNNSWVGDYENYVQPSTSYSFETFSNSFYPAVVDDFAHSSEVLGVPLWMDTFAILYNVDALESQAISSPPTNWTEFKNASITLTEKNGSTITQSGFAVGTSSNVSFSTQLLYTLFSQNGVSFLDADDQAIFSTDDDSVGALSFYKNFGSGNDNTWSNSFENDALAFAQNDAAMIYATSWRYRDILNANEQFSLGLDIGVSQVPQLQAQDQPIINWADYWGNMVALNRPYSRQAWDFLEWMSQPEQLQKLHENTKNFYGYFGSLYPRSDMSQELAADQYLQVYNESLPYAQTWYQTKGIEVKEVFRELIDGSSTLSSIASAENDVQTLLDSAGEI